MNNYSITNIAQFDTPLLVVYKEQLVKNIAAAVQSVPHVSMLRPHAKTHKMKEVALLLREAGVHKFKCATIAEAEMLALAGAEDVLLAYQPVGPKVARLLQLTEHYPDTVFSCVADNPDAVRSIATIFQQAGRTLQVWIDLDTGMHRTGVPPEHAFLLFSIIQQTPGIQFAGLHSYDGHISYADAEKRQLESNTGFARIQRLIQEIGAVHKEPFPTVLGGSPTFLNHAQRGMECSPGTFVFWDYGYKEKFPEAPFHYAALVVTRIISVGTNTVTTDLGYKSVASESPLPRVKFLNAPEAESLSQSEEHLVLKVPDAVAYKPGDVLYGVPLHICPTVALYERAYIIENNSIIESWRVVARDRVINF